MRVAIVQINTTVGDLDGNAKKLLDGVNAAAEEGAKLVVASELCIPGYPPQDLLERPSFIDACARTEQAIVDALPEGVTVVFGNVRRRPVPPTYGRALQNVAVVARRGEVLRHVVKSLLPTYDVFDEARYFEPRRDPTPNIVEIDGVRVGVTVCEDLWNDDSLWKQVDLWRDKSPGHHRLYASDPVKELADAGMELLVNVSASPWAQGKIDVRTKVINNAATRYGVPVVYANHLGANDGLIFDGTSFVYAADGECITRLPCFEEAVRVVDTDDTARAAPLPAATIGRVHDALVLGVRDYFRKTGLTRAVIGLSGGIDSAVTAYVATQALGKENVIGVAMPSRYSSEHSVADAKALAENLGVRFELIGIEGVFSAYLEALAPVFSDHPQDVTEENLQARTRGGILMAFANKFRAVVLSTGNKSEAAVGYCTLYGDTIGALCVIADLYKHQVYDLARYANRDGVVIPTSTIDKPPSAELRPDQKDEDSLPPYDKLDRMLELFLEHRYTAAQIAEDVGVSPALATEIITKVYRNEFKRKQLPPTLRVSRKAWVGREYPIVQRFSE
ncbi:MAG: NAD+ synthase [Deltaproteobacteria bacterium]|jgi:NAD+ synthase (glutamine-hydrolysing)